MVYGSFETISHVTKYENISVKFCTAK